MDSHARCLHGMTTFGSTQIGFMESKTGGRGTNSNAGEEIKVRNEGWKGVDILNNYLNGVVMDSVTDTQKSARGRDEG